jgi:hypothetical protein
MHANDKINFGLAVWQRGPSMIVNGVIYVIVFASGEVRSISARKCSLSPGVSPHVDGRYIRRTGRQYLLIYPVDLHFTAPY